MKTHLSQLDGLCLRRSDVSCWTARRFMLRVGWPMVACVLAGASPGLGQYGQYTPRALAPSQSSAALVSGVGRSFGRGSGLLGESELSNPLGSRSMGSPSTVGSLSTLSRLGAGRNWRDNRLSGGGGGGYRPGSLLAPSTLGGGYGDYRSFGSGLIGGRGWGGGRSALARSYDDVLQGSWSLGLAPTEGNRRRYEDRKQMLPLVGPMKKGELGDPVGMNVPPATQPSDDQRPMTSMRDLVATQLGRQRQSHVDAGWEAFKAGDYAKAAGEFTLAEGYSSVRRADKIESRLPLLYARIAVQQYAEATGSLSWMLEAYARGDDKTTPGPVVAGTDLPAGGFAATIPELPARYKNRLDLETHLQNLGAYVAARENAYRLAYNTTGSQDDRDHLQMVMMEARALQVMMWYAIPEQRSRAVSEAQAFGAMPRPWNQLAKLLAGKELNQQKKDATPTARPANPGAEFPFNIYQEAQAPADQVRPPVSP